LKKALNIRLTFHAMSLESNQIDGSSNGAIMKHTRNLFNWLVGGAVMLAMVTSLTAQTVQERTGQVVRLKGAARYSGGNNVWQPVKVGTKIKSGDIVQTAADSYIDILLGETSLGAPQQVAIGPTTSYQPKSEQDIVRVFEDSVLGFDKLTVMRTGADEVLDTQLDLRAGKIFGSVKKMSAASRYEIKLPNGVAGVRGTTYTMSAAGVVQVNSGSVVVSWTGSDGKAMTQVINAGFQFDLRTLMLTPLPPGTTWPTIPAAAAAMAAQEFTVDKTTYYVSPK
jgi:hypothetical protein